MWRLTDLVFEKGIKGYFAAFIFPSWNWFHAHTHTCTCTWAYITAHPCIHMHTEEKIKRMWEEDNCTAIQRAEPDKTSASLSLMHLHHYLLTYPLPPSSFCPHQWWHSAHRSSLYVSLFECIRPITSLLMSMLSSPALFVPPKTPSLHWQLSGKG